MSGGVKEVSAEHQIDRQVDERPEEYMKTEVGVIPEDWNVLQLQDICRAPITYGIVQCGPNINNGIPYIRVSDMKFHELDVSGMLRTSSAIAASFSRSKVDEGDIVYALRGKLGEVRLVSAAVAGANLTQGTARISPNDHVLNTYLLWILRSEQSIKQAYQEAKGSTFVEITLANLKRIQVPVPRRTEEQTAIANTLTDVDALITSQERLIAKKRAVKTAAMQQLLTGKKRLPPFDKTHTGYKQTELGEIPEDWEVKRLDTVSDVIDPHPSHRAPPEFKSGIPFVGIGDINSKGNLVREKIRTVSRVVFDEHKLRYNLVDNLIGLGRVASIGKVVRLRNDIGEFTVSPTLGIIKGIEAKPDYLFYCLSSHLTQNQFRKIMSGSTRSSVGMVVLRELEILIPSLKEQTAIVSVLADMDKDIDVLEQRLTKTQHLKQGMMQELLTGKTRLV